MKKIGKVQTGFTLIELMVVIVIIGILIAIALPNFLESQRRAKFAAVKSNAKTLQVIVETYNIDYGTYPDSVSSIEASAGYKKFSNPFTGASGSANSSGYNGAWRTTQYGAENSPGDLLSNFSEGGPNAVGLVLYQGMNNELESTTRLFSPDGDLAATPSQTTSYLIIGCTDKGKPLLKFVLSSGVFTTPAKNLMSPNCWGGCVQ